MCQEMSGPSRDVGRISLCDYLCCEHSIHSLCRTALKLKHGASGSTSDSFQVRHVFGDSAAGAEAGPSQPVCKGLERAG